MVLTSITSGNRDYVEELALGSEIGLLELSQRRRWLLGAVGWSIELPSVIIVMTGLTGN
jgi:hypothetical protein